MHAQACFEENDSGQDVSRETHELLGGEAKTRCGRRTTIVLALSTMALGALATKLVKFCHSGAGQSPVWGLVERDENWANNAQEEEHVIQSLGSESSFLWGAATAAYQVEGASHEDGRTSSIWDDFAHTPGKVFNDGNGDVACDFYHRYEDDLKLLESYGFNTFRFSISWTRVLPMGKDGKRTPNQKGIEFYKSILRSLKEKGITPMVTMFHWDLPSDLSWLDRKVIDEFVDYADFLWKTFPEVDLWITLNEPFTFCFMGYDLGVHAPGVKDSRRGSYTCGHHALLAHAKAVALFKAKYKEQRPRTQISMTTPMDFPMPRDQNSKADREAVDYMSIWNVGRFMDPIFFGDYPKEMRDSEKLKGILPKFSSQEKAMLKGSYVGFYGMNTYGSKYVWADDNLKEHPSHFKFSFYDKQGIPVGTPFIRTWLFARPDEIYYHLKWVNDRYGPESIIITENGVPDQGDTSSKWTVDDPWRISYYRGYLSNVARAKDEGVPVKGYVAWALMDNFEWADGYKRRFGLTYVDFQSLKRTPKASAKWFKLLFARMRKQKSD
eukprot:TRINITY_DN28741_c0_g1_i1.p1 TRINITY_DN28741_c0_g1~~TRINITY_DN28741_c0_g1_i1.p1  ORF type:complete len:552 (-),score=71.41 TRINITY_DN28741_c0_g1_i1:30-1685(-)